jgi:hypothetical protein
MLENILTKSTFTQLVEDLVLNKKMGYIEAVLFLCDERQIDPADIGKVISPSIKSKIEAEAMSHNLLPKSNSLESFLK